MIHPECLYTTKEAMALCGMGEQTLVDARLSGIVTPIQLGRLDYYIGRELIAFALKFGKRKPKPNRKGRADVVSEKLKAAS